MYRFLMVDDEEIIRRGFETRIDWGAHGFEFLPPCKDGREALAAVEALDPDVVMTDICMPHADGIALAAWIAGNRPDIIVVVLSGYDEFGYAQAAIRHRVFDYVLKPVSAKDLSALLLRIRGKLDAEERAAPGEAALPGSERAGDLLRERNLLDWLSGALPAPSPAAFAALYGFDPSGLSCSALLVDGGEGRPRAVPASEPVAFLTSFLGAARHALAFSPAEGKAGALLFDVDARSVTRAGEAVARSLLSAAGKAAFGVGLGRAYLDWVDAPRAWDEACASLAYRLLRPAGEPLRYQGAGEEARDVADSLHALEERLRLAVRSGDAGESTTLAGEWIALLDVAAFSPQRLRHEVQSAFSRLLDDLVEHGFFSGPGEGTGGGESKDAWYLRTSRLDSREGVLAAIDDLVGLAASSLEWRIVRNPEWKVLDFKELVSRRFAERDFSIAVAAARLGISESWLSKLLRRYLDNSFVDYLAAFRVERAKELLRSSDMMTYEVAEAVGVPDSRYFSGIFKRHAGMTPTEFRTGPGEVTVTSAEATGTSAEATGTSAEATGPSAEATLPPVDPSGGPAVEAGGEA